MIEIELVPNSIEYIQMDDERYFSEEYSHCISNSRLTLINPEQGGSREKYLSGFGKSCSDSLVFGSAVHELVLQPDDFCLIDTVDRPTGKLGHVADHLYKKFKKQKKVVSHLDIQESCKAIGYYANSLSVSRIQKTYQECYPYLNNRYELEKAGGRIPIFLDKKGREKCLKCIEKLQDNPKIMELLHPFNAVSENEAALFIDFKATDTETGKSVILRVKGKLDNSTINEEEGVIVLNDLKTTGHLLKDFANSFKNFHYSRQMAIYTFMLREYAKKYKNIENPKSITANMLVVSTIPDFYTGVYKVSSQEIQEGFEEFIRLLKLVAEIELEKA